MRTRSTNQLRAQGYFQGRELSDECTELYAAELRQLARFIEGNRSVQAVSPKIWDGTTVCAKSGIAHAPVWDNDPDRPTGRRLGSLELRTQPKYCGTAKTERRVLEECGMAISDTEVEGMFRKNYHHLRRSGIPHLLFGHQNFNDGAIAHSYMAGAAAELIGRRHIGFVTELLATCLHQGPGKLGHDPKVLMTDQFRKLRELFPNHHVLVMGFFENIIREVDCSSKSRSHRYIEDVSGAAARKKKQQARKKKNSGSVGEIDERMEENVDAFLARCFTMEMYRERLAAMYSGSEREVPPVEVPHVHYLIAVFNVHGQPLPLEEVEAVLKSSESARHQIDVQKLYDLDRTPGVAVPPSHEARNAHQQAAACIKYAIKRSGGCINDRDLQFRNTVRGVSPNQGFFDTIVIGKNLGKRSKAKREIPPLSTLGKVMAERSRLAPIVGVECPNNGQPETIRQIESRLLRTPTPMVWADGTIRQSAGDLPRVFRSRQCLTSDCWAEVSGALGPDQLPSSCSRNGRVHSVLSFG
jgi:hypothetical protein